MQPAYASVAEKHAGGAALGATAVTHTAGAFATVLKTSMPPCVFSIQGGPITELVEMTKSLACPGVDQPQARPCYLSADNKLRTIWTPGSATTCDNWVVEENIAAPVVVTLKNCTDSAEAANLYFRDVLMNADAPFLSPCQYGHDLPTGNMCVSDVIFAGLCAHTCNDLRQEKVGGAYYTTQKVKVGDNAMCDGDDNPAANLFHTDHAPMGVTGVDDTNGCSAIT